MFLLSQSSYPRPILYLCKQGVAALFSFFRNHHFQNAARWARGSVLKGTARRILKIMISEVATEGRILDLSYTHVNKGSPPSLVFFEMNIFKMRRAGPGAPYLRGPRAAF